MLKRFNSAGVVKGYHSINLDSNIDFLKWFGFGESSKSFELATLENLIESLKAIKGWHKEVGDENTLKLQLHTHTIESDGRYAAVELIDFLQENWDNSVISITDHNSIVSSIKTYKRYSDDSSSLFIPGIEVAMSDWNEVLLYFRKPEDLERFYIEFIEPPQKQRLSGFIPGKAYDVVNHLKMHNFNLDDVIIGIPHPFAQKNWQAGKCIAQLLKNDAAYVDLLSNASLIEAVNAFHSPLCNIRTMKWLGMHDDAFLGRYHFLGTSDFHSNWESLLDVYTVLHFSGDVSYDNIFDYLKSPRSNTFCEPVGTRITVFNYLKQACLAGLTRLTK